MKHIYLLALLLTFIVEACNQAAKTPALNQAKPVNDYSLIKALSWLDGSWQSQSPQGKAIEVWTIQNDSVYAGKSFFVSGSDTLSSETITLEQTGAELNYIPVVKNQNLGKPVKFKLTDTDKDLWVFENPAHDFPTVIKYRRIGQDSLLAEISGMQNGKEEVMQFAMKRQR